jgi:hypothetical protein
MTPKPTLTPRMALLALALVSPTANARPQRRAVDSLAPTASSSAVASMPLRLVVAERRTHARYANCIFSTVEVPVEAQVTTPLRDSFAAREPIWGRCYLPERLGANRPGELVDVITVDGKRVWEQAYDQALPADALARLVPYSEVLRPLLRGLAPGGHRVTVEGSWRRGKKLSTIYRGAFRYVR